MTFDDVEIDAERYEVRRAGQLISVEPKVFDLLHYLAKNPDRLVTKDELIATVWSGRVVSDATLSTAIKFARRALGDTAENSRIKTVRGRGFRFELSEAAEHSTPSRFSEPAFAVLPVNGAVEAFDAEALVRRILSMMSHLPYLRIIAPSSMRHLKDATPQEIARDIGEGFLLELNPRFTKAGHVFDCVLYHAGSGDSVWMFQAGPLAGATEDEMASTISVQLEPQLLRALQHHLDGATDPRALALQAMGTMALKGWNIAAFTEAETGLRKALEAEPDLAFARAALALVTALGQRIGVAEPDPDRLQEAIENADKAIALDGMSPLVLGHAGCALVDAGQHLRGRSVLDRALSLDPMNAQALAALATIKMGERDFAGAVQQLSHAVSISPNDSRLAIWRSVLALAHLKVGDQDAALREAQKAVAADDRTHMSRVVLAYIHTSQNALHEARAAWREALRVTPGLSEPQIAAIIGRKNASLVLAACTE